MNSALSARLRIVRNDRRAYQVARFLLIGLINTAFGYSVFAIGIVAGLQPSLALLIATFIGVVFNFFTTGRLVFRITQANQFLKFVMFYVLVYLVNLIGLNFLIELGLHSLSAQAMMLFLIVPCSFLAFKYVVFVER